jgi:proteasome lid subunit RPN8/RPN11
MRLVLPPELRAQIERHARLSFPRECCGLIEGTRNGVIACASALHPARNIAAGNDRFEIHPEDHFAALKVARSRKLAIIGCYHSHPGGTTQPSGADRAGGGEEDFLWLIAALARANGPATLAVFAYSAADFFPVEVVGAVGADLVTSSEKLRN